MILKLGKPKKCHQGEIYQLILQIKRVIFQLGPTFIYYFTFSQCESSGIANQRTGNFK